jgi:hypothetical protein
VPALTGDGGMRSGKTKLLRVLAARERREERDAKREARRRFKAERRAAPASRGGLSGDGVGERQHAP